MMTTEPLPNDMTSVKDQAAARGEPVPVGKTVRELRDLGYVMSKHFADDWVLREHSDSPTGYAVFGPCPPEFALAY